MHRASLIPASPIDKPSDKDAAFFALPGQRVVALDGRDAVAFAQAQCMSDVATLGDAQWHWSGWLTPKGRLIALFALLRLDAETLWLLLPDADPNEFASQLQRFLFRSKVAITVRDDLQVSGAFTSPCGASGADLIIDGDGRIELDFRGDGGVRTLRLAAARSHADSGLALRWTQTDLAHGLPRLPGSQSGQWTPQQLSLERLRAYSVRKGCYPGQEIVARTHFLGQAKRGLVLLESEAAIAVGAGVHEGDDAIGKVVSAAGNLGLAVLPLGREFAALSVDDTPVCERPLQGGLAR
ncbi:MAG: YgfZ/GcvT domain-containing protein [Luteimonas sp.]